MRTHYAVVISGRVVRVFSSRTFAEQYAANHGGMIDIQEW